MNQKNNNISSFEYLSEAHFKFILEKVLEQVFGEKGKGYIRHGGKDTPLSAQTWKYISDQIGSPDFCIGQAIKKLSELKGKPDFDSWNTEIFGAIVYTVFAAMYQEYLEVEKIRKEDEKDYYTDLEQQYCEEGELDLRLNEDKSMSEFLDERL
jgi:hypothetical protein